MPGDRRVWFGGRGEETDGPRGPYLASFRSYWNVLEGSFEMLLVNAEHIEGVPGRETVVKD